MSWRALLILVPLAQIVFSLLILPLREGKEIFPLAPWNLFSRPKMHNTVLDVQLLQVDARDLGLGRPFHDLAPEGQNYELRRALEFFSQPTQVAHRLEAIDPMILKALKAQSVRYQIVLRRCDLLEFFKTRQCTTQEILMEHHAGS